VNLCADYTHVVAHVVLGHPYKLADVALRGVPVDRPRDVRVPPPHRGGQLPIFDVVEQQREEGDCLHVTLN
jgi:hypothetical protein